MSWRQHVRCLARKYKSSQCLMANKQMNGILVVEENPFFCLKLHRGYASSMLPSQTDPRNIYLSKSLNSGRNMLPMVKLSGPVVRNIQGLQHPLMIVSRQFGQSAQNDPDLSRDFFVQLWVADRKMKQSGVKRRPRSHRSLNDGESGSDSQFLSKFPSGRHFSGASAAEEKSFQEAKPNLRQPPPSQSVTGILQPSSPEEAMVAPLLARSNLLITRDIEWANLVLGFEQENRYAIVDVCYPQSPAGYIREKSNLLARQLLRLRRPFVAYITDGLGNELFRVRRPFWWITSSIYAEINGKEIGVVHRRWHLWRRIYDLYLGNDQFAVVENPGFWNWTFTLKDIDGKVLAQIDRDWRGFGFEIFTDAGQYVIQFGKADSSIAPVGGIQELDVVRPLTLSERAVAVALAISLDNDYFSRHGGWGIPFVEVGE
ncbi:PREDICTED: altered inheritance rate of mitochondria protein 25 [Ipomoea nil]|uniref:altered inheritance rate of mitochondria protein 25 n=1 Tax=Ipomoea nil TaxID=35883 RepID=UPI000901D74C|nr:PREDICTED: altered inheritance rate of mitochondria protein 25 [Ipomoea nil]XP_019189165.1 PREDICTED: altered inheritance rate of mitochondria protein 25 [Ipomoea nil]